MDKNELQKRMEQAIRLTAPGQPIRTALDMIIAGHLGALICVGDTENVLAAGNDGFPLNISFTSNRLFELSKMDGAIVIDGDLTQILRANFHLNPDPSLATSETGMRHRTAARMSVLTDAIVISVSARRAVVNVYVHGKSYEIQPVTTIMSSVNQLVATLQTTRQSLDRSLLRLTAPGQPIRTALDMIIAGHLGALICVGDTENVLAAGNDGFPLNISFTSNRLFELSKMDGAIVIDGDLTQILRANFHLNPDPSLATSETGMRHRTAARMSVLTDAIVISVSARRAVVNVYVHGKSYEIQPVTTIMSSVNQLVATLQTTRQSLDRSLLRLTALELDDYVTLADITGIFSSFEIMQQAKTELKDCIVKLGNQGKLVQMQLEQLAGSSMDTEYDLMIRDYASDSSEANAEKIRAELSRMTPKDLSDPQHVAAVLGYDDLDEDSVMTPLGLRTLSRVSVVRDGVAEKIVDEYGSLQELMDDISEDPERLGDFGVNNPAILADSLYRMKGTKQGNA